MGDYKYSSYTKDQLIALLQDLRSKKRTESTMVGRDGIVKEMRIVARILEQRK